MMLEIEHENNVGDDVDNAEYKRDMAKRIMTVLMTKLIMRM